MIVGNGIYVGGGAFANINVYGLQQTDSVVATKGSKTKNGVLKSRQVPLLPSGYTELEYIQTTGTQYIDTGIKIAYPFYVEAKLKLPTLPSGEADLFGDSPSSSIVALVAGFNSSNVFYWGGSVPTIWNPTTITANNYMVVKYGAVSSSSRTFELDGTLYSNSDAIQHSSENVGLFSSSSTSARFTLSCIVDYCKIYNNNTLVRNFIPCKRNSDNAIGMYDLVSNSFFENSGSGTFIAGNEHTTYVTQQYFEIGHISELGTWSVTATSGSRSKSISVLIDVITDYDITWSWMRYLYNQGDECENITGGWAKTDYTYWGYSNLGTLTKNIDNMTLLRIEQIPTAGTTNLIDLSSYSTLKCLASWNNDRQATFGVASSKTVNVSTLLASSAINSSTEAEYSVDISSISSGYVFFADSHYDGTVTISKVWLE